MYSSLPPWNAVILVIACCRRGWVCAVLATVSGVFVLINALEPFDFFSEDEVGGVPVTVTGSGHHLVPGQIVRC